MVRNRHASACAGREWRPSVAGGEPILEFGIVGRRFLSVDVDGVLVGALADPLGGDLDSISENVAEALSLRQLLEHGDDRPVVAPGHFDAAGVFLGDDSVLVALDRESHARAGGNRVHPEAVADVVRLDDRLDIVIQAIGAEHADSLVLRLVDAVSYRTRRCFFMSPPQAMTQRWQAYFLCTLAITASTPIFSTAGKVDLADPGPVLYRASRSWRTAR